VTLTCIMLIWIHCSRTPGQPLVAGNLHQLVWNNCDKCVCLHVEWNRRVIGFYALFETQGEFLLLYFRQTYKCICSLPNHSSPTLSHCHCPKPLLYSLQLRSKSRLPSNLRWMIVHPPPASSMSQRACMSCWFQTTNTSAFCCELLRS